ncbi:MAG: hypothetical protein ACREH3_20425, partial [Geminicoccales bacterium]
MGPPATAQPGSRSRQPGVGNDHHDPPLRGQGLGWALSNHDSMTWLLLIYTVPSEPSRLRAAVWRDLK